MSETDISTECNSNDTSISYKKTKTLELIHNYPNLSKMEIGRKLVKLGLIDKPDTIYQITRNIPSNVDITGEIEKIRSSNLEYMSRTIVPLSLQLHNKALRSKDIDLKDKLPWISLAEKTEFRLDERKMPVSPVNVNIGQLQAIITSKLSKDNE